jgi:hypothetical protein
MPLGAQMGSSASERWLSTWGARCSARAVVVYRSGDTTWTVPTGCDTFDRRIAVMLETSAGPDELT